MTYFIPCSVFGGKQPAVVTNVAHYGGKQLEAVMPVTEAAQHGGKPGSCYTSGKLWRETTGSTSDRRGRKAEAETHTTNYDEKQVEAASGWNACGTLWRENIAAFWLAVFSVICDEWPLSLVTHIVQVSFGSGATRPMPLTLWQSAGSLSAVKSEARSSLHFPRDTCTMRQPWKRASVSSDKVQKH